MQKIDRSIRIVKDIRELESIIASIPLENSKWCNANINASWGDWVQVIYSRNDKTEVNSLYKPEYIKVYTCVKTEVAQDIFVESLIYLLQHVEESFAAKLSTCSRSDQMCYWLSSRDFHYLQEFYQPYCEDMVKSLPFVAYDGKFRISRDFPGTDYSHNGTQAYIISDYLKSIDNKDDIDLEDMYNNYIAKWNADIYMRRVYIVVLKRIPYFHLL